MIAGTNIMIKVGVAYATSTEQVWHDVNVPEGATVMEAIKISGILNEFPEINLKDQKVGIFGKITQLNMVIKGGDRVEIYRPITVDPQNLERKKYKLRKMETVIEKANATPKISRE